jgi:hypothetical protein
MDDPNEEFVFYLEAVQGRLEGNKTFTKVLEVQETAKKPLLNNEAEKTTSNNIASIIIPYLYEIANSTDQEQVLAGSLLSLKDFEVFRKKNEEEFNLQFEACLKNLEAEEIISSTGKPDVFGFKRSLFEKLGINLYHRLKNEAESEFSFHEIYTICNELVSKDSQGLLSKDFVFKIVMELHRDNRLYKADKNSEKYGVS